MRHYFALLVMAGLGMSGLLGARGVSLESCCCNTTLEVGAEVLILRPSGCDMQFTVSDPAPFVDSTAGAAVGTAQVAPVGTIQSVNPDYSVGFRVILGAQLDGGCSDVRFIYTWFHSQDHRHLVPNPDTGSLWASEGIYANPLLFATEPGFRQSQLFNGVNASEVPAFAKAKITFDYDAGDLQLASRKWTSCNLWTRTSIGLHVAHLDGVFHKDYQGVQNPGEVSPIFGEFNCFINAERSWHTWGIGPRADGEGVYHIGCNFGIAARAGMGLLVGNRKSKFSNRYVAVNTAGQLLQDWTYDLQSNREVGVTPEFDARLGLSYLWCCDCMSVSIELGYEWITYLNFVPTGPEFRIDKGITRMNCDPFSLDGVYISVLAWF